MHSLAPEIDALSAAGAIDESTASKARALDSGAVFPVFEELRAAIYVAVLLLTTGIGLLVKAHLDDIGPAAILAALGVAAALCYASAVRTRRRGETRSIVGDYVLLLGAVLLSIDVAYGETQYHWLGPHWSAYLLVLTLVHGATAYALDSRLVLTLALTSLAGWFGVAPSFGEILRPGHAGVDLGGRELGCAAVVLLAGLGHRRVGGSRAFADVYDHLAATLAFAGALAVSSDDAWRPVGVLATLALAAASITEALRSRREAFAVYGVCYGAVGLVFLVNLEVHRTLSILVLVLGIVVAAALLLWYLHALLAGEDR